MVLTPTWHVFHMYKGHQGATLLGTSAAYSSAGLYEKDITVPGLSVSASEKTDDATQKPRYLVTAVNTDASSSKKVDISFANLGASIAAASGTVITGDCMNTINTFDDPERVTEKTLSVTIKDADTVSITMPAHSVASVTVQI